MGCVAQSSRVFCGLTGASDRLSGGESRRGCGGILCQGSLIQIYNPEGRDTRMRTSVGHFTEVTVEVASTQLYLLQGGTGRPLIVLHGVEGHEGWLAFHEALAEHATV